MYCSKCGKQLPDDAVFCTYCGNPMQAGTQRPLLNILSQRVQFNGVIWIAIGVLQIASLLWGYAFFLVGILNLICAIQDIRYSKAVLKEPRGIVERYEPLLRPILVLIYNLLMGGVIGVVGSIYCFIAIRSFVMENKEYFAALTLWREKYVSS